MKPVGANSRCYLVGGGIASLASAAYLIRDGGIPGRNIRIFEESGLLAGSLDAQGSPERGYIMRGGRTLDLEAYTCTYDLLSFVPSLAGAGRTVKDEVFDFNRRNRRRRRLHRGILRPVGADRRLRAARCRRWSHPSTGDTATLASCSIRSGPC